MEVIRIVRGDNKTNSSLARDRVGEMKPWDMILAGLGNCIAMTVETYASRKEWPLEEIIVYLKREGEEISVDVEFIGELTAEQRNRLALVATKCPISKQLQKGLIINKVSK